MPIVLICPSSKTRLTLGDDRAGSSIDCPRCHTVIGVPVIVPPPPAPPPLPPIEVDYAEEPAPAPEPADEPDPYYRPRRRKKGVNIGALIGVGLIGLLALILVVAAVVRSKRADEHNAKVIAKGSSAETRAMQSSSEHSDAPAVVGLVFLMFMLVGSFVIYFAPTFIALARGHNNIAPIIVVNFFLGWALVGWVIALARAFTDLKHLEHKRRSYL